MAVTSFDGQFSFKQDSLARLGHRESKKMSPEQYQAFQNSPFMQGVKKCEDLCWKFTCKRDQDRAARDPSFKPVDEDFNAPKAHNYDRAINYYKVLGLDDCASLEEVKKSYKKLSLVYHPDKTAGLSSEQKEEYAEIFIELKNAYLTLGDQATRRQYDRDRDRDKASFEINGFKPKVRASFDATEMLKKLQEMQKPPGKIVDVVVAAKLEKFFYGGHKRISRQRRVKDFGGFSTETRNYRVDIPRGANEPHECMFKRQGDHNEHTMPDSLLFKISCKPHSVVHRVGDDLHCKASVYLGTDALRKPYVTAEAGSVRGRHLLLWGRNPFAASGALGADLQVKVHGQGLAQAGSLNFTVRLGSAPLARGAASAASFGAFAPAGRVPATSSSSSAQTGGAAAKEMQVIITVRHMQTDGKLFLRVPRTASMADIRAKITSVVGLPRGSTVRLLQQIAGGFTPFPDRQTLGTLTELNCAGTAWSGVSLTADRSLELLRLLVATLDGPDLAASVAAARAAFAKAPWEGRKAVQALKGRLATVLPDFGLEASADVLTATLSKVRGDRARRPDAGIEKLLARIDALDDLGGSPTAAASPGAPGAARPGRRSMKRFLLRHGLGPPGGFHGPGSETEDEAGAGGGGAAKSPVGAGREDLRRAPAMLRRAARGQARELACCAELSQVGEPITLFTRPTCSITFYSNAQQPGGAVPGKVPPKPLFAIALSAPSCAKKAGAAEWEALKRQLVPVLRLAGFHMLRAARGVLPRSLTVAPAFAADAADAQATRAEARGSEIDLRACCATLCGRVDDAMAERCAAAAAERSVFLDDEATWERRAAACAHLPVPWKRLGDTAFKRGDYFSAMLSYSRCLDDLRTASADGVDDERGKEAEAVVLSNRAACLFKVRHYEESLADARAALVLRPLWGRAWSRVGQAAGLLGSEKDSRDAFMQAVNFEPSAANVEALAAAASKAGPDPEAAHAGKEEGNIAMRGGDFGLAVAHFTNCLAMLPPDPRVLNPDNADEHAFLRAVLLSNRSAAFARLKNWPLALADGRKAVAAKDDFAKAHCRLGVAMLGHGLTEAAYVEFAKALRGEASDPSALKARQTVISTLPLWSSAIARRRLHERFSIDLSRPAGSTKVYAISDVFFDHKCNEEWAHRIDDFKFQEDVLIVAGNMCDTRNALQRGLTTLKSKFRRIFYVPGNHEHWVHPSEATKYPDSFAKMLAVMDTCDEVGVDIFPAAVAKDVFVVPLLSWYTAEFDVDDPFPDPNSKLDQHCRWPIPDTQIWKYMLKLNNIHLDRPYHGTVISCSHFLPSAKLPHAMHSGHAKAMGCEDLDVQVRRLRGSKRVHVYGHSHRQHAEMDDGILYVNHHHGEEGGKVDRAPLLLIHDGRNVRQQPEPIYDGQQRL